MNVSTTKPCVFCEIVARRVPAQLVFEDALHLAFLPLEHINRGHLVVIPKLHNDYLFDLAQPEYQALWSVAAKLAPGLRAVTSAARVGVAVEGFSVPHVHIHLVPVNAGNELNPSRARPLAASDADHLAKQLRYEFGA